MATGEAGGGFDVADGRGGGVGFAGGDEFEVDGAAGGVEVCFPAALFLGAADGAGFFVKDALAFAAELVGVFGAGGGDDLGGFFNAPVQFADAPAALDVFEGGVDDAFDAHLHGELADRVDDGGEDDVGFEVGGREDADGVFVHARHEGALDGEGAGDGDFVGEVAFGVGVEDVVDHS